MIFLLIFLLIYSLPPLFHLLRLHVTPLVIILFNTGLCWSAFSTISFWKLVFHLFVLSVFFVLSQMCWIRILNMCYHLLKRSNCYVILFSRYKNFIKKLLSKILKYSQESNCVFNKVSKACNIVKRRLQNVFFREYCKFFSDHLFWKTFANGCFWNSSYNQTIYKNSIV